MHMWFMAFMDLEAMKHVFAVPGKERCPVECRPVSDSDL